MYLSYFFLLHAGLCLVLNCLVCGILMLALGSMNIVCVLDHGI